MALYTGLTKKGSMTSAKGSSRFERFKCDRSVDKQQRAFQIELTDDETGKKHSIVLYGDEFQRLREAIFL